MRLQLVAVLGFLAAGSSMAAQLPDGIPRDLARQRAAQISDVRYQLHFTLTPHAPSASGHEELRFRAKSPGAMLLDFREGTAANLAVNGVPAPARIENGHIELPANVIHAGENVVTMDFTAPI